MRYPRAFDLKGPLLLSEQQLAASVQRLFGFCGLKAAPIHSTLSVQQDYYLIDREFCDSRPDLSRVHRALFGSGLAHAKATREPFLRDVEEGAKQLGIPVQSVTSRAIFTAAESTPMACDHNLLLMELMHKASAKFGLVCLFHEKPFQGAHGSGKLSHWSIATDAGRNLFDSHGNTLCFLALLTATICGAAENISLLRAGMASPGNDCRSGETDPSIHLSEGLRRLIDDIVHDKPIDLACLLGRIEHASLLTFTGNQFALGGIGASGSCAWPIAILNAIVASRLELLIDQMEDAVSSEQTALPALRAAWRGVLPILFAERERARGGLCDLAALREKKSIRVLQDIFSEKELARCFEALIEPYAINDEAAVMLEMFYARAIPSVLAQASELELLLERSADLGLEAKAKVFCELMVPKMALLRSAVGEDFWE